ncbi:hypothetical protein ACM66B_005574 [Microbotryomycetes sp. NB124-2]
MLSSPPILLEDDLPPLFAPRSSTTGVTDPSSSSSSSLERRPPAHPTHDVSSDDSINTVSSITTRSSQDSAATDVSELARELGNAHVKVDDNSSNEHVHRSHHSSQSQLDSSPVDLHSTGAPPPSAASNSSARRSPPPPPRSVPNTNDWRRQTLPALITDAERALRNIRSSAPSAILGNTSLSPEHRAGATATTTGPGRLPMTQHQGPFEPALSSSAQSFSHSSSSSPVTAFAPRSTSSSLSSADFATTTMAGTANGRLPSPIVARPGSSGSGKFSSTASGSSSMRPWVKDSDASSICSAASSCWSSCRGEGQTTGSEQDEPEVYKPIDEGLEFFDPRPEPQGAHLSIHRDDPRHVLIKVILPGFSIENITVAMRREHKVHIVADSYGENGGHFEKLVSLGTEVSSAAPRAEFDGSELMVYIRRKSVPSGSRIQSPPMSPPLSHGSPTSSLSSSAASPRLDSYFDPLDDDAPVVTRSTADSDSSSAMSFSSMFRGRNGKSLTGPEGARAAAKAAREEAARRAKEAAKSLPSCGSCKFPFKRGSASSMASSSSGGDVDEDTPVTATAAEPLAIPARSGTIKARTPSPSSAPAENIFASPPIGSTVTPSRPKFRSNNLTLKATDRNSFIDTVLRSNQPLDPSATSSTHLSLDSWPSPGSQEGSTPRVERVGLDFSTSA